MTDDVETAGSLFRAGKLAAATEAAGAAVKKAPTDLGARVLLAEFLLAGGNLERADVILDAASEADPAAAVVIAEFRQLLRAEMARRQLRRGVDGDPSRLPRRAVAQRAGFRTHRDEERHPERGRRSPSPRLESAPRARRRHV